MCEVPWCEAAAVRVAAALKSQPWSEVRWCEAAAAVVALEAAAVAPAQRSRVGPAVASAAASNYELSRLRGARSALLAKSTLGIALGPR